MYNYIVKRIFHILHIQYVPTKHRFSKYFKWHQFGKFHFGLVAVDPS